MHATNTRKWQGNDVRLELIALRRTLPAVYMEVVTAICNTAVGESVELYKAFVSYAHQEPGVSLPHFLLRVINSEVFLPEKIGFGFLDTVLDRLLIDD